VVHRSGLLILDEPLTASTRWGCTSWSRREIRGDDPPSADRLRRDCARGVAGRRAL